MSRGMAIAASARGFSVCIPRRFRDGPFLFSRRNSVRIGLAGFLLAAAGGCADVSATGLQVEEQFEVWESGGAFPSEARELSGLPFDVIAANAVGPNIWYSFEIARRFENGIDVDRDFECAAFWYSRASRLTYNARLVAGPSATTEKRRNHPLARAALRRLSNDAATSAAVAESDSDVVWSRCFETYMHLSPS